MDPIIIMNNLIKLEIFVKNEGIKTLLHNFRNKYFFKRENRINEILGEELNSKQKKDIFGVTYDESDESRILSIKDITHVVQYISIENGSYYGHINILDTPEGRKMKNVNEEFLILYPKLMAGEGWVDIRSIDLGYNSKHRNEIYKRILNRK